MLMNDIDYTETWKALAALTPEGYSGPMFCSVIEWTSDNAIKDVIKDMKRRDMQLTGSHFSKLAG